MKSAASGSLVDVWVLPATDAALDRMVAHAAVVALPNTDEATFRSFFMAALRERYPHAQCETEWCRFDLLVRLDTRHTLIEFKYYVLRRMTRLDGTPGPWKGGPGSQNVREFVQCVEKLRTSTLAPIHTRYLVQVYQRPPAKYHGHFDRIAIENLHRRSRIERGPFVCNIYEIRR